MRARVAVVKINDKYHMRQRVAYGPLQEKELETITDGEIIISLTGDGERSPAHRDFIDDLHDEATRQARELGIKKVHGLYNDD